MKRPTTSVADDLIVEPIEEAFKLYDELLKELDKFMVSNLFTISPYIRPGGDRMRSPR
jgi:hypothetical protein